MAFYCTSRISALVAYSPKPREHDVKLQSIPVTDARTRDSQTPRALTASNIVATSQVIFERKLVQLEAPTFIERWETMISRWGEGSCKTP